MENLFNNQIYKYNQKFNFILSNNDNNSEKLKQNTIRFRLVPTSISSTRYDYLYFNSKIILTSQNYYYNISGTLEVKFSLYAICKFTENDTHFNNKKIVVVSDTKVNKCLNIDFEVVDNKYIDLVIRYNQGYNLFNMCYLSVDKNIEEPILSYEDISKIQEWY